MFTTLLEICSFFCNIAFNKADVDYKKIERASELLFQISEILEDTYYKLISDTYPHNNCVVMENFARELQGIMSSYLTDQQMETLNSAIIESVHVEKLFAERGEKSTLEQLLKASGHFRTMSMIIKIEPIT